MKIDGQCHCGAIAYEAELDPAKMGICHCSDCQLLSGSAFRTVAVVSAETFRLIRGTPKEYIKTAESGNARVQAFCGECGSALYACDTGGAPAAFNLRAGTIRQRAEIAPRFECWRRSALPWVEEVDGTVKFEKAPG
ncbi:MAG: GFA family protein [Pseudomonadota bacterium]